MRNNTSGELSRVEVAEELSSWFVEDMSRLGTLSKGEKQRKEGFRMDDHGSDVGT
jgi:hypothetical protein